MESREDLKSILPYLPLVVRSSSLSWSSQAVVEALKAMARGPSYSGVNSGEVLFLAISDLRRHSFCLSPEPLAPSARRGYAFFFDEVKFFPAFFSFRSLSATFFYPSED